MGIPSYFSYIIKNHSNIIRKLGSHTQSSGGPFIVNNLYMDCNSIIYDVVRRIFCDIKDIKDKKDKNKNDDNIETIIREVCIKIDEYIFTLKPNKNVFISFDGVAPVAKLEQQRSRRYKSLYQSVVIRDIQGSNAKDAWNTTAITPGTVFMKRLNDTIYDRYCDPVKYGLQNLIVSGSDEPGEGEHKLFDYIRTNPEEHQGENTVIYGLDADLIMLSINHLPLTDKIYLFRETPEFVKSINAELEPNETYILDIPELARVITLKMNNGEKQQINRIYDYVFLCFFLGNDFMPHFPSVNIRTGGIDKMLNAYRATIGSTKETLTDGTVIYWKNVRKMVQFLADNEENFIKAETKSRDKREKAGLDKTPEERFMSVPTHERSVEKFINPFKPGWQSRYYKALFGLIETDEDFQEKKRQICVNYLEGLEWTMKYYTSGCADWRWKYEYNYPPLFEDLIHAVPYFETVFVEHREPDPVNELVQLCYVLPRQSLQFLPEKLCNALLKEHGDWYDTDCDYVWAYCRYFWEAHVVLPTIDIKELEKLVLSAH